MLIAIDHGNKQIKSAHKTFTSGLCVSDMPPFGKDKILLFVSAISTSVVFYLICSTPITTILLSLLSPKQVERVSSCSLKCGSIPVS